MSGEEVILTGAGKILREEWNVSPILRPQVTLDGWVIMPNHFHAIVWLEPSSFGPSHIPVGAHCSAPLRKKGLRRQPRTLGSFMAEFKASVTRQVRGLSGLGRVRVWQRGYFERVIRDDRDLHAARRYILENPLRWEEDHLYRLASAGES